MNTSAKQALNDAMKTLNISEPRVQEGKKYSIVEFCNNYLELPLEETVAISKELVYDIPVVYLREDNWGDTLQRGITTKASAVGNNIRQLAQNKFGVGATGNKPQMKQGWNRPVAKVAQGVQNFFNTKGAALRNSPMIRVDDNAKGVTKYIAFPDLDLARPGHKRVLDTLIAGLSKDGKTAQQINVAAPERDAAQKAGNYAEIDTPDGGENKKEAVEAALQQLEDLVTTNKDKVNQYSFMSQEELDELQQQITASAGQANQTISAASQESQADTAAMAKEATTTAAQPSGQPQGQPGGIAAAHAQETSKIQSAADMQAQNAPSAPQAAQPSAQPATSNVQDAEIIPPTAQPNPAAPQAPVQDAEVVPNEMPALGTIQNQADGLAASAQTKMSQPVDAAQAAANGSQFQLNPGLQSGSPKPAGATFGATPTISMPGVNLNQDGKGFSAEVAPGFTYNSANSQITNTAPADAVEPEVVGDPSQQPAPATGPTGFESAPEGEVPANVRTPLAQQLANQPQGTIDDTLNNLNATNKNTQRPPRPKPFNPADPNSVNELDQKDLESPYTDPTDFAHV